MPERDKRVQGQPISRQQRRRQERERQAHQPPVGRRGWAIGGIVAALLVLAGGGYYTFAQMNNSSSQAGGTIDGIQCGSMEGQAEHIHTHLALFWNGRTVTIPAYVGIPVNQNISGGSCFYWLHTHATTDIIHVEAPASGTYTLNQFFDVWRQTALWDRQSTVPQAPSIDDSFVTALRAAKPSDIHVYVGKQPVSTAYGDVTLADHKMVTIELGTPLKPPVATFDWKNWKGL